LSVRSAVKRFRTNDKGARGRRTRGGVLGQQAMVSGQPAECELFVGMIQGDAELTPATAVHPDWEAWEGRQRPT